MDAAPLTHPTLTQDPIFTRALVCERCNKQSMSPIRVYKGMGAPEYALFKGAIVQDCQGCHAVHWHFGPLVYEDAEALVARFYSPALGSMGVRRFVHPQLWVAPHRLPSHPENQLVLQQMQASQPSSTPGTSTPCSNDMCLGRRNGHPKPGNANCVEKLCNPCCQSAAQRAAVAGQDRRCSVASHRRNTPLASTQPVGRQPPPSLPPPSQARLVAPFPMLLSAAPVASQEQATAVFGELPQAQAHLSQIHGRQPSPPATPAPLLLGTQQPPPPPPSTQPSRSLAQPMNHDWVETRHAAVTACAKAKSRKVVGQEMTDIERQTIVMVIYHAPNAPPVVSEVRIKSYPKVQPKDIPGVAQALRLENDSFIDVFQGGEFRTIHADTVLNLENSRRIILRARESLFKGINDSECPGLDEELAKHHHRRNLKRQGVEMVSPLKKTPRSNEDRPSSALSSPPTTSTTREMVVAIPPQPLVVTTNDGTTTIIKQEKVGNGGKAGVAAGDVRGGEGLRKPKVRKEKQPKKKKNVLSKGPSTIVKGTSVQVFRALVNPSANLPTYPFGFAVCDYDNGHREIKRLQYMGINQCDSFSSVFGGSPYVKSTVSKYRGLWAKAPADIRDKYIQLGRTTNGLFEQFANEVKSPKGAKAKKQDPVAEESDYDSSSSSEAEESDTALSLDDDHEPDRSPSPPPPPPANPPISNMPIPALCPFCDRPLPTPLTTELQNRLRNLVRKAEPDPTEENPGHMHASCLVWAAFCADHETHRTEIPYAAQQGWPVDVDFTALPSRIQEFEEELQGVVDDPDSSDFFVLAKNARLSTSGGGAHVAAGLTVFGRQGAAYYGERGFVILTKTLQVMFPQSTFPSSAFSPLSWRSAIEEVLLPEAAILLIMQDRQVTVPQARQIHTDSRRFGILMHPAPDVVSVKVEPIEAQVPVSSAASEVIDLTLSDSESDSN